jgi:hypothetical protein
LPKGTAHYVIDLPPPSAQIAPHHAADVGSANAKTRPAALKPVTIHLLLVPDGARTWVGLAADESVLVTKVNAAMAGSGDTLASRSDLASLKAASIGGGGFVTLSGLAAEFSALAALFGAPWKDVAEPLSDLGKLPHHGSTPMLLTGGSSPATPPTTAVFSLQIPRGVVDDVVVMAARHGGF